MRKEKPKSRENVLSPEERERILKAIRTEDEELAVKGLLFTGMRVSEFSHLRREWIDWEKGVILVPLREKCDCYECATKEGEHKGWFKAKTPHASRAIPLLPETKEMFSTFFGKHNRVMDALYNRVNIWRLVGAVKERARISHPVFPHCLRSTFASILADKGFDAFTIQAVLGWKKITMAEIYIKMSGSSVKQKFKELW